MSQRKTCFKIADHVVSVEGFSEKVKMPEGFDRFIVHTVDADFCIHLNTTTIDLSDMDVYYTLETPLCNCFFKQKEDGYGMYLNSSYPTEPLFLRYTYGDDSVNICGNLDPIWLKFALWVAFGILVLKHRTIAVHASSIIHNGKAILFLGESGTGKSTQSKLWMKHIPGTELLNDDSPLLRIEHGKCYAYGSPWSGKTPCYKQKKVELAAIIRLSQASINRMEKLDVHRSVGALYPSFPPSFSTNEKLTTSIYDILSDILPQAPIYHLECLPDKQAALLVHSILYP